MASTVRHPDKALSAAKVRNAMQPGRYADGEGLYMIVEPSGAKRWLLRIVVKGKRCDLRLGAARSYPWRLGDNLAARGKYPGSSRDTR